MHYYQKIFLDETNCTSHSSILSSEKGLVVPRTFIENFSDSSNLIVFPILGIFFGKSFCINQSTMTSDENFLSFVASSNWKIVMCLCQKQDS